MIKPLHLYVSVRLRNHLAVNDVIMTWDFKMAMKNGSKGNAKTANLTHVPSSKGRNSRVYT